MTTEEDAGCVVGEGKCASCSAELEQGQGWGVLDPPPCPHHPNICLECLTKEATRGIEERDLVGCPVSVCTLLPFHSLQTLVHLHHPPLTPLLHQLTLCSDRVYLSIVVRPFYALGMGRKGQFRVWPDLQLADFQAGLSLAFSVPAFAQQTLKLYQKKENEEEEEFPFRRLQLTDETKTVEEAGIKDGDELLCDLVGDREEEKEAQKKDDSSNDEETSG